MFFLLGHPGETVEEQQATIDFACELEPDYASFHIASPYPGTAFHQISGPFDEPFPSFDSGSHELQGLEQARRRALRSFYLRPGYVLGRLHPRRLSRALAGARLLRRMLG